MLIKATMKSTTFTNYVSFDK